MLRCDRPGALRPAASPRLPRAWRPRRPRSVVAALGTAIVASTLAAAAALSPIAVPTASAQVVQQRLFPATALRGQVAFTNPPEIVLNGQPARLAPGARIRGEDNLLRLPGAVVGQKVVVHYTRDAHGQPLEVWILTTDELKRPWPRTEAEAQSMTFDAGSQQWEPK